MKVLVTGGTGFVGSHVARAALAAGHQVRLLARDPAKAERVFPPNGAWRPDIVPGDMLDAAAVAAAVSGCHAVVHCAAQVGVAGGTGPASGPASEAANADGARTVFGAARSAGCDPVIYTSSVAAHLPSGDPVLTAHSPLADQSLSAYGASKRDTELLAAGLRADGVPLTSVVLGGVYGPGSPHLDGASVSIIAAMDLMMLAPPGGVGIIDVRDTADLITRLLVPGLAPRRIMAGGRFVTWLEWAAVLSEACGREVPCQAISAEDMISLGQEMDRRRAAGQDAPPLSAEAAVIMSAGRPTDDGEALRILGRDYRPTVSTFRDTVEFLRRTGRLAS